MMFLIPIWSTKLQKNYLLYFIQKKKKKHYLLYKSDSQMYQSTNDTSEQC